jgi:hypothetical protein
MMHRPVRTLSETTADPDRATDTERAELAAFFRELGLGWEIDPERLVDRLAHERSRR